MAMADDRDGPDSEALSKVPAATLGFWITKILATTLGETGGDTLSMTFNLGYLVSTFIFAGLFLLLVTLQIRADRFWPLLYWATVILSTMVGTTLADFVTRSIGIGYPGGSLLLFALVMLSLLAWRMRLGSIQSDTVRGTAPGDWVADSGPGYSGAALLFGGLILVVLALYRFTSISRVALFWAAFILSRPLGAALGDFLDKPLDKGGLDFSRPLASSVLLGAIGLSLWLMPQRPGGHVARPA